MKIRTATDLGIDLDRIAARRVPREWVYLDGCAPWEAAEHDAVHEGAAPCPVCGGLPLAPSRYCAYCDRAGLDGQATYPGYPVDYAPDPHYPRDTATRYAPDRRLRGGVG